MNVFLDSIAAYLERFTLAGQEEAVGLTRPSPPETLVETVKIKGLTVRRYTNEYWTARQRQAAPIHEISYRACFKAQLPRFFINLLTGRGELVYDPFSGRGTTAIEAGLTGRRSVANDINPLSEILAAPRLNIPDSGEVRSRLGQIPFCPSLKADMDLSMFYHPHTEGELVSLRAYLFERRESGREDAVDRWIRMVATNRLTGHSTGFFSVYTLPPNQAVSPRRQAKINQQRNQVPPYRNVRAIIIRKTERLLKRLSASEMRALCDAGKGALFLTGDARSTPEIATGAVSLTVTSPPFLDQVNYLADNWLRCWFNTIDGTMVEKNLTMTSSLATWKAVMAPVFKELYRVTRPGGWVAFEVGEIRKGLLKLEEEVLPLGLEAGFSCFAFVINRQHFTKTANIWGVQNNERGTNSNRIVLFYRPPQPTDTSDRSRSCT